MTAEAWLTGTDPQTLLDLLRGRGGDRQLRLFACACCRRVWDMLPDVRGRTAVEVAEHFADGLAGRAELAAACQEARELWQELSRAGDEADPFHEYHDLHRAVYATEAALFTARVGWPGGDRIQCRYELQADTVVLCSCSAAAEECWEREYASRVALLRCIFGNPFRPVTLDPALRTATVVSLAQAAYDDRLLPSGELDPDRVAVLADALEELGCPEPTVLEHLREPVHVRGCFAVDLLINRG